jgi:VIT1/CCC1 family predicted Fe2+/Mn2+ transporter
MIEDPILRNNLLRFQKDEVSSFHTYNKLAGITKNEDNRRVLKKIAEQEMVHYQTWKRYTQKDVKPDGGKIRFYYWISKLFGLTFGIKLMERGEENAQRGYSPHLDALPEIRQVLHEEELHEKELLDMIDEESLKYAGSVVLGLNDALVELTGALAGLTLAFQNTRVIAMAGLITGISASLSMAASEYLSTKAEGGEQNPNKSALYTGIAYVITVILLIVPYFVLKSYILCLVMTIAIAIAIIAIFNFYISVAKDLQFRRRFIEMTLISLGVALLSFLIGDVIRKTLGINI